MNRLEKVGSMVAICCAIAYGGYVFYDPENPIAFWLFLILSAIIVLAFNVAKEPAIK